jgi:hypothetical protein
VEEGWKGGEGEEREWEGKREIPVVDFVDEEFFIRFALSLCCETRTL